MKIQIQLSDKQMKEIIRQVLICLPTKEKDRVKDKVIILRNKGLSTRENGKIKWEKI